MQNGCPGLWEKCSKKSCIEQEQCVDQAYWVSYWKNKYQVAKEANIKANMLYADCGLKNWACNKRNTCKLLGQCILNHPLVANDKMAAKQLRKSIDRKAVVKILECLMPSLKRVGKRRYYKPDSKKE